MTHGRVLARYRIETPASVEKASQAMAGEQSTGTFVDVPLETSELQEHHGAAVERIERLETVKAATLPGSQSPSDDVESETYHRALVDISYPMKNIGPSIQNLLTTVGGNLFELCQLSGIKLIDIELPAEFISAYPGPQFGSKGTREIIGVEGRPLIGTIIKPSVGLSPTETGSLVRELAAAGLDFIKDDELIADPPYSPVEDRVTEVMGAIDDADTEGDIMYACNITGDMAEMLERADTVVEAGGNCVMVSMNSVGLSALRALRREVDLPIHAHRNGWGALSRCSQLGFDYRAYHKFFRLAGADHLHVNGIRNKFAESDQSVIENAQAIQTPLSEGETPPMPVFSSSQWAGQAPDTYEALGNTDLLYLAGGGILGHPNGPSAGVTHLKQGWEAAMKDVPLEKYAQTHEELRIALEYYGEDSQ